MNPLSHGPSLVLTLAAMSLGALAACGDDEGSPPEELGNDVVPDVVGEYDDGFAVHRVDGRRWRAGDDRFYFVYADNDLGHAVALNSTANAFSPGLWSRFDWTTADGHVWYCQTAFDAPSRTAAFEAAAPDASAPGDGGCGGFSWSTLVPLEPELAGAYNDGFADHTVEDGLWTQTFDGADSLYHLVQVSNAANFAIARNDDGNAFGGGQWSRFDWVDVDGELWVCQTVFDAASRSAAATAEPADASDPATGGCGGFPWSPLSAR